MENDNSTEKEFDLAIHLVGTQTIPNLLAIRQIKAGRHLLLTSSRTRHLFERLKKCEPNANLEERNLNDPFDMAAIVGLMKTLHRDDEKTTAINLTGGTKTMAFGAYSGSTGYRDEVQYYYYDSDNDRRWYWGNGSDGIHFDSIKKSMTINDFIYLSDFQIQGTGPDMNMTRERRDVTMKIWEYRYPFARYARYGSTTIQKKASNGLQSKYNTIYASNNDTKGKNVTLDYRNGAVLSLAFDDVEIPSPDRIDLKYLAGGWFEEFVYWNLEPLLTSEALKEIRLEAKVMFERTPQAPAQEFDVLATDGLRLYIIECKSGIVPQASLDKLENNTRKFAGVQGSGILALQWPLDGTKKKSFPIIERTEKSEYYACIHGDQLENILQKCLFTIKPGDIKPTLN